MDGQVYCVNCESWIFDNKKESSKKQKFGELVSLKGKREVAVKNANSEVSKVSQPHFIKIDQNLRSILERKLMYLANLLDVETDLNKIK